MRNFRLAALEMSEAIGNGSATIVERSAGWYRQVQEGQASALASCLADLRRLEQAKCR